jgi:hypothetical protein
MSSGNPTGKDKTENYGGTASSEHSEATAQFPPADRIPKSDIPPSPSGYQITCKTEKDWRDKVKFWAELVGLAFLIAYTIFAGLQWCEMRKAANAAKGANEAAREALIRSQRPWVGITEAPTITRILNEERIIGLQVTFWVKNYGPSPAIYLNLVPGGMPVAGDPGPAPTVLECKIAEDYAKGHIAKEMRNGKLSPIGVPAEGFTVFPNERLDIRPIASYDRPNNPKSYFTFYGCVAYGDQFGKSIHHTPFCCQSTNPLHDAAVGQSLIACMTNTSAD